MDTQKLVLHLLRTEKLCFLATSHQDRPHVSLMNFTYLAEDELIVLSSRSDTTKVKNIEKNAEVALLLYNLGNDNEMTVSCTLFGTATILSPDTDRHYRELHYKNHPDMGTFIQGNNIAILAVKINKASLSDIEDNVQTWSSANEY